MIIHMFPERARKIAADIADRLYYRLGAIVHEIGVSWTNEKAPDFGKIQEWGESEVHDPSPPISTRTSREIFDLSYQLGECLEESADTELIPGMHETLASFFVCLANYLGLADTHHFTTMWQHLARMEKLHEESTPGRAAIPEEVAP